MLYTWSPGRPAKEAIQKFLKLQTRTARGTRLREWTKVAKRGELVDKEILHPKYLLMMRRSGGGPVKGRVRGGFSSNFCPDRALGRRPRRPEVEGRGRKRLRNSIENGRYSADNNWSSRKRMTT